MRSIEYTKKPSGPTLRAALRKALNDGATWVQLTWGENQITVERTPRPIDGVADRLAAALGDMSEPELGAIRSALVAVAAERRAAELARGAA